MTHFLSCFSQRKKGSGRFQEMSLHHQILVAFDYCPLCALLPCERSVFKYLQISREVSHVTPGHVIDIWVSHVSTHRVCFVTWGPWIVVFDSVNIGCVHIWSCSFCGVSPTPKLTPLVSLPEVSFQHWTLIRFRTRKNVAHEYFQGFQGITSFGCRISQRRQSFCRKLHENGRNSAERMGEDSSRIRRRLLWT